MLKVLEFQSENLQLLGLKSEAAMRGLPSDAITAHPLPRAIHFSPHDFENGRIEDEQPVATNRRLWFFVLSTTVLLSALILVGLCRVPKASSLNVKDPEIMAEQALDNNAEQEHELIEPWLTREMVVELLGEPGDRGPGTGIMPLMRRFHWPFEVERERWLFETRGIQVTFDVNGFVVDVESCQVFRLHRDGWHLAAKHAAEASISTDRIRADVKHLSSDQLEGRGIGGRGEELATEFIAKEFQKAGLDPAGERGTFFQRVDLLRVTTESKATLSTAKGGRAIDFRLEDEFVGQCKTQRPVEDFDAEAVFLGHGINAPEYGWNDYQGADVKGKVVIVFTNEPPSDDPKLFRGKSLTYYGRWSYKYEEAARRGAKAVLIIHTTETAGYPYSVVRRLEGVQPPRDSNEPALAFAGWLSRAAGEKLMEMAGKTVDGALKEARTPGFRAVSLGMKIKGHIPSTIRKVVTKNVIGIAPGSDPVLKSETVIFTAHWDHLGLGKAVLGDNIYNGAADNATGCAILLEMARAWAAQQPRPKRSAIFLATTAEENGLLGAYHYAKHPVVPLGKTALNLNFDTVFPLGVPESVIVSGAERTTAWPIVQDVARKHKLAIDPESQPEQGFYYRSDHFALAKGGVPAFSVRPGSRIQGKPADFAQKAFGAFNKERYHTPQDEFREDWDFSGYPTLIRFALDIAREAANQEKLPTWNDGDEFLPARRKSGVR